MKKFLKLCIVIILIFSLSGVCTFALSKMGSQSEEVKEIQSRLKNWGYYDGKIDGIYGTKTKNAVIAFQKKNGLNPDGIAGKKTLTALGIKETNSNQNISSNNSDYELLARLISAEARGESYMGQVAVGAVVLNRIEHPSFPDTLSGEFNIN